MSSPAQSELDEIDDRADRQVEAVDSIGTNQPRLKPRRQQPAYYHPSSYPPESQSLPRGANLTDLLKATFPDEAPRN